MCDIRIHPATSAHLPQILELYKSLQPQDPPIDERAAYAAFENACGGGVVYFVALDGERVVGTCYIAIIPNITKQCASIGLIENVVTAPDCLRKGIGRKLMEAAVDHAKRCGCYKVMLQSGIRRKDAHRFYESVGFDGLSKKAFEMRF